MKPTDLDLPPDLAEMVGQRKRLQGAPEAAKARLHRRLSWAFTADQRSGVLREAPSPRPEQLRSPPIGWFQQLLGLRLALLAASFVAYLPLAVAAIGLGAASLAVVYVRSHPVAPAPRPHVVERHPGPPRERTTAGDARLVVPQLAPLPEPWQPAEAAPAGAPPPAPRVATVPSVPEALPRPHAEEAPTPSPAAPLVGPPPPASAIGTVPGVGLGEPARPLAPSGGAPSGQASAPSAALERRLLEQARSELRSGAVLTALASLDRHRALYPESPLSEEREVLRIEASVRSGGVVAAGPMVADFRQRYPRSPLLPALEAFLKSSQTQMNSQGVP